MISCKECNCEFEDDSSLHYHLRNHKLTKEKYYQKFYPRLDLLTKEPLEFKTKEHYFNNWFSNRTNCIKYIKELPNEAREKFICDLIENRKRIKGIKYLPSQVELRSCVLPSIIFLEKLGYCYNDIGHKVNLINKYDYTIDKLNFHNEPLEIICDTREQTPLNFKKSKIIINGLNYGDYTCKSHFNNVFIERKSPTDFINTFSSQVERFEKELDRAKTIDATILVLVEFDFNDALGFNHVPYIKKRTNITPDFVFHNVRKLCQKYTNVQFAFVDGRKKMVELIEKIYSCEQNIRVIDLQYAIDKGLV
jgi:hypothetical protein